MSKYEKWPWIHSAMVASFAVLVFLFLGLSSIRPQENPNAKFQLQNDEEAGANHPHLLLTPERVDELKQQILDDRFSKQFFEHLVFWADSLLLTDLLEHEVRGRRLLHISQQLLEHVTVLGVVYHITGEHRYANAAIRQLRAVAEFPDWNPTHFLDTAEMTAGLALGYDWFHDQLSNDDKTRFLEAIVENGLLPSFEYDEWATRTNNWNSVGHGGMALGALAVSSQYPDIAHTVLQRAKQNVALAKSSYEPDGAYKEGPMYWKYGTNYLVIYLSALKSSLDEHFDIGAIPGFMESADYMLQVVAPTGSYYNYGDNFAEQVFTPALFWFEMQTGRADYASFSKELVLNFKSDGSAGRPDYISGGARFAPLALLWHNPSENNETMDEKPLFWMGRGDMPVAVMRSAWDDENAAFLGIKGGSINVSHAHMDLGSFVIEADGVRWAVDPGHQNYHQLEEAGLSIWNYQIDSDRWKVFRLGPEGHSILRVDGALQNFNAFAPVIKKSSNDSLIGSVKVILDDVYTPKLRKLNRTASLVVDRTMQIRDEWVTGNNDVEVSWQLMTRSKIQKTEQGLRLHEEDSFMDLIISTTSDNSTITIDDVSGGLSSYDAANPGLKRIRVVLKSEPGSRNSLTATFYPGTSQ